MLWAAEQRLALAQRLAPGRNEVAGALEAVKLLSLKGCIATVDALHCNRPMAQAILDAKGQYVMALKENQSGLFAAVERRFAIADQIDTFSSEIETDHKGEGTKGTLPFSPPGGTKGTKGTLPFSPPEKFRGHNT